MKASVRIIVDEGLCVGCSRCVLACSFKKEGEYSPARARIRLFINAEQGLIRPTFCQHCSTPECVAACKADAIKKDGSGLLTVDAQLCTGCGSCIAACRFGAISIHPDRKVAILCDHCEGEPECVKYCVTEALRLSKPETTVSADFDKVPDKTSKG